MFFFCLGEHLFEKTLDLWSHRFFTCAHDTQSLSHKVCLNHSALLFFELGSRCLQYVDIGSSSTAAVHHSISINPLSIHLNRGFSISLHCSAKEFFSQFFLYRFPWEENAQCRAVKANMLLRGLCKRTVNRRIHQSWGEMACRAPPAFPRMPGKNCKNT